MNDKNEFERETWVDFVRVTAIFLVVLLHSAAPWLYKYGQIPGFDWQVANIIDSATRISVPLFFMTTGYLLLHKPVSLKTYFSNRLKRIVIPWLAWSCIYLIYKNLRSGLPINIAEGFVEFANGEIYFHFWFLYALIGLYLFIPVISWFTEADTRKRSLYFLAAWIVTASIIPFLNVVTKYATNYELTLAIDLSMFGGFSGYLIAGALIGRYESSNSQTVLFSGAYVFGVFLTIIGTTLGTYQLGRFTDYFYDYAAPNTVIAAFAAFAVLKKIGLLISKNKTVSLMLTRMGYATLGIFLIHPMILNAINDGALGSGVALIVQNSPFSIPFVAIVTFFLSYTSVEIIVRMPVIRRIV